MQHAKPHLIITLAIATGLGLALGSGCDSERGMVLGSPEGDFDEDTISNADEGDIDTDGDGTPDYADLDSDNDGVLDIVEAGDADLATPPADSDRDGAPDFRDPDSDGNGFPDAREGNADTDGDGQPDRIDLDDDDDGLDDVSELAGRTDFPVDFDGDGIPDFRDRDSDGDTILDGHDGTVDTDGDGFPDFQDTDSDDDLLSDADEAGDADLETVPIDSNDDGRPDFRDPDADGDGLPDGVEVAEGTDPSNPDSDGDGVSDLIEVAAGTDPRDASVSPRTRGDFVFVLPYQQPAEPGRDTLRFRTNVQFADVYFLFDTTGSMEGEIRAMRGAAQAILDNLTCADTGIPCAGDPECGEGTVCSSAGTCIADPRDSGCVGSMWSGLGTYAGLVNSYRNELSLQPLALETQNRIPSAAVGGGGDETLFESVACVADPTACAPVGCAATGIGCPGYRADAVRMLITITDEPNGCSGCGVNTASLAGARLRSEDILFVGVDADAEATPEADLKALAVDSGSLDPSGAPYYVQGTEAAVTAAVTEAIERVTRDRIVFVSIESEDLAGDDGDALQFIDYLEVNADGSVEGCPFTESTVDTDGDGFHDAFPSVRPGTPVCWDVIVRDNTSIRPTSRPFVYIAELTVRGDGSVLDTRTVYFVVPPVLPFFG